MKRLLWIGLLLGAPCLAAPARYELDPEHLTIAFMTDHLGFAKVLGTFAKAQGSYVFDADTGELSDVRVVVETASVDTGHERRDEHLRSNDFLGSAKFPRMTFTAAGGQSLGNQRYAIAGQLELKGVTRPLRLEATLNKSGPYPIGKPVQAMGISARGQLRRSEFGMTYSVDNGWVGDTVELIIEFEARRP